MVSNSQHLVLVYLTSNLHRIVVLHLSDGVIAPSSWSRIPSSARAKLPCNDLDGWIFFTIGIASGPFSPDSITSKAWIPPLSHRMVICGEISFPLDAKCFFCYSNFLMFD